MKFSFNQEDNKTASEQDTYNLNERPFEERVFARFDAIDARFLAIDKRFDAVDARFDAVDARFDAVESRFDARFNGVDSLVLDLDARVQKLEVRAYDTKPIWEQALKEIGETKREIVDTRRELSKRLDRIEAIGFETRADLRDAEDRIERLESKLT